MATPDEVRAKIARLRRGVWIHGLLAVLFLAASIYAYFDSPATAPAEDERAGRPRTRILDETTERIFQWEVVVMGAGIALANLLIAVSKSRRASGLSVDPDADHPEAKVFE